jgi:hypothetical protein
MNRREGMKIFHKYNKEYLLNCGFKKIQDTYVKLTEEKDCLIVLYSLVYGDSILDPYQILGFYYLYQDSFDSVYLKKPTYLEGLLFVHLNIFYISEKYGCIEDIQQENRQNQYHDNEMNERVLSAWTIRFLNNNVEVYEKYVQRMNRILQNDLSMYLQCQNYSQARSFHKMMYESSQNQNDISEWKNELNKDGLWEYYVIEGKYEQAIKLKEDELDSQINLLKQRDSLDESTFEYIDQFEGLTDKQKRNMRESHRKQIVELNESAEKEMLRLIEEKEAWLALMRENPTKERNRLIEVYQRNLKEVEILMQGKNPKPKIVQKVIPKITPNIDNLERIVIRRGTENWKQIQTYMDEFFKTKGYHRRSNREMWERTWCIVETQNFWIIMELDESGITNEHLNDYDQLSKHLTKVLVTSGFFLYSFEFTESLARLYEQGECVDHWVIDEGFEVDEQEISQPLAWESSKIANPYRLKDPEEVHLIDILYDWMEMLKINPQWMVEEVDSTQNFKKCHIFGYAIAQHSSV